MYSTSCLTIVEEIPNKEIKEREELFRKAREGDPVARTTLKVKFNITAIWDGKKLIRL